MINKNIEKLICPNCKKQIDFEWQYICDSTAGSYLIDMCSYCKNILSFTEIEQQSSDNIKTNNIY